MIRKLIRALFARVFSRFAPQSIPQEHRARVEDVVGRPRERQYAGLHHISFSAFEPDPDADRALDAEYDAHVAAGRCPDCAMGLYPWYGHAPGASCGYVVAGENIPITSVIRSGAIGLAHGKPLPPEQWPSNFEADLEDPTRGTWFCPRCGKPEGWDEGAAELPESAAE